MPKNSLELMGVAISYFAYVLLLSLGTFLARPDGADFPGYLFFFVYHLLPCLASWVIVVATSRVRIALRVALLLVSLFTFSLLWHLELRWLLDLASGALDRHFVVEARNYVLFSYRFFVRSFVLAVMFLLVFGVYRSKSK